MTDISVIVPAHNAAETIGATLRALLAQNFAGDYEVIVVDDGSTDATAALTEELGARVVRHETPMGPAVARNSGRSAATGELLAFTDADCEPAPNWLTTGYQSARDADLVQGSVKPTPGVDVGPFDRTLRISESSPRLYETANLFVRAALFDRIGGFRPFVAARDGASPPGLRPAQPTEHFGEDIIFGWEARRLGARVRFDGQVEVYHAVFRRGPRGHIRERWRLRYMPAIVRVVPELRSDHVLGVFLNQRTVRFDLALAGIAAATLTGRRWPLAAGVPYIAVLRRSELWRRSAWRENLGMSLADAVTFAALVRGSAAARELVL